MVNKVIDGMAEAMYNAFGEDVEIYTEPVKQGLIPSSFSVRAIHSYIDRSLNNQFKRTCLMEVNYFPQSDIDPRSEIQSKIDTLFDALEVIKIQGVKVRGIKADYRIVDDVLVATLRYVFYTIRVEDIEYMADLTQSIQAR